MAKYIAIDLDTQGLFAVSGTARGGNARVEQAVAWTAADGEAPPPLSLETAKRIGEQLRDRLRAAGAGVAPALVVIDRDRVILKELRYPAVPPAEEPNLVRFQAMKELSDSPDDVVLDYVPLSNGSPEGERHSMAVVVRKDYFAAIQAMCAAANLKLAAATPRPFAIAAGLTRAFTANLAPPPDNNTEAIAALTIGPGGGEFTVVRNGEVTFTRAIKAPSAASEPMLLAEVRRNLTTYAGSNPGHPVQSVYVAEADGRWASRLRTALGIPVHSYDPLAGAVPAIPEPLRGRFAGAVGLLAARGSDAVSINFASPRQPKAEIDPKRNQFALAALLALLLLAAIGVWGYFRLEAATAEVARLNSQKTKLQLQLDTLDPDSKRLAAANAWKARRVVWLDEWFDMADRFPVAEGFYAISFTGKATTPDARTGKQENQGQLEFKVAARKPDPVNALLLGLEKDNVDPKSKYYVGVDKVTGGPTQGDSSARDYTVTAKVNSRPAAGFSRAPGFTQPSRKNYPPQPVRETRDPETPTAPEPKVKEPADTDG